jgi:hypothetical protein
MLCQIPSPEVIKDILFGMQSLKSPGPDGLPPLFYKKYWKVVGQSVIKAVQNFFVSGKMLKEVNNSFIVLIPKIQNPSTINHFRPISLCNTIYKIISKLIVEKLRSVIPNLISPAQSAFHSWQVDCGESTDSPRNTTQFQEKKGQGRFFGFEVRSPKGL